MTTEAAIVKLASDVTEQKAETDDEWPREWICPELKCSDPMCEHVLAAHPVSTDCPDAQCLICSARDCPSSFIAHYDNDGCPACGNVFVK